MTIKLIFITIFYLSINSCSNKVIKVESSEEKAKNGISTDSKINIDSIKITCNNSLQNLNLKYNPYNNNFYRENSLLDQQMKCLSKAVNEKNQKAISEIVSILDNIKLINPYLSNNIDFTNDKRDGREKNMITKTIINQKWRGEEVFKSILECGNFFGCYRGTGLNCGDLIDENMRKNCYEIIPVHNIFFDAYTSMIRNIDGLSVEEYLQKNISHTIEIQLKREQDKCQETLYKEYYEVIKLAYDKGLVVLKDYGEN